jgi:hypothetical protein
VTGCSKAISPRSSNAAVLSQDKVKALLSSEHFSVDGTLLEAWASLKSFRPRERFGRAS